MRIQKLGLQLVTKVNGTSAWLSAPSASAAILTVANLNDTGAGSLSSAIASSAANDIINFAVTGTITNTSGFILGKNLTIAGPGATNLGIASRGGTPVFTINSGVTASMSGLRQCNNQSTTRGIMKNRIFCSSSTIGLLVLVASLAAQRIVAEDRRDDAPSHAAKAHNESANHGIPFSVWKTIGNAGTTGGTNFLGTTDNQPLEFKVNNQRALRLDYSEYTELGDDLNPVVRRSVNVVGGHQGNIVSNGIVGATIAGGGIEWDPDLYPGAGLNRVTGHFGTVGGGDGNTAGLGSTVGGGDFNWASDYYGTVGGGSGNLAGGTATVGGGVGNSAIGVYATVGVGWHNSVASYATIAGGVRNSAHGQFATVGGGEENSVSNSWATVSGGRENIASGIYSTVGGGGGVGSGNRAIGFYATIGGGTGNAAIGQYATVPGGGANSATNFAFAAGSDAQAIHDGTFVWADASAFVPFYSMGSNEFAVRATGGVRLVSAIDVSGTPTAGVSLAPGAGDWSTLSDRQAKENFAAADSREILDKVASLPLASWNYRSQDKSVRHLGPTAQDFHAAFGLGENERTISTVDADGVALAAIQGLNRKLEERDARIAELTKRLEQIERLVTASNGGAK